jgi:hypothetical protein
LKEPELERFEKIESTKRRNGRERGERREAENEKEKERNWN